MALEEKLKTSDLGLKGNTPNKIDGTSIESNTHVNDAIPGSRGDEKVAFKSSLAPLQEHFYYDSRSSFVADETVIIE